VVPRSGYRRPHRRDREPGGARDALGSITVAAVETDAYGARDEDRVTTAQDHPPRLGALLREWRQRRRLSQLDLALQAGISTRHLSFVETSRARPSREMVLHLADHLEVPLRDRNSLLLAAGYAPVYTEWTLDSPHLSPVRRAIRQVMQGHEPHPAVVVDRLWNLVDSNSSVALLTVGVDLALLQPPVNVLRLSLHPGGLAPSIVNLGEWRAHLLDRLRRQVRATADPQLAELYDELCGYPCPQPEPDPGVAGPGEIVVPLRLRRGDAELSFFSTVATLGTPLDVTLSELVIESFFPADEQTAAVMRRQDSDAAKGTPDTARTDG
jgi:transcriptional regulator with XRE-family HTH domain